MNFLVKTVNYLEYLAVSGSVALLRHLPFSFVRAFARTAGAGAWLWPGIRRLVSANIHAALPEYAPQEVRRIGKASLFNLFYNLLEYVWIGGKPDRIRLRYRVSDEVIGFLNGIGVKQRKRILFVSSHLGSWEASGCMVSFFCGVPLAAVAKPMSNPYLNDYLLRRSRESTQGLEITFSKGAVRASQHALRDGKGLGLIIDQNARVRDGGVFVDFFGLPVPCTTSPAVLWAFCRHHGIPAEVHYGLGVRGEDGFIHGFSVPVAITEQEEADPKRFMEKIFAEAQKWIRRYPEQYLWLYHRFQYVPPDATPEVRARYPFYAKEPPQTFYSKVVKAVPK